MKRGLAQPPVDEFNAEQYKTAATEHAATLTGLYEHGYYVLATYVAGVAMESMFRAYRMRIDPQFDSRHDLHALLRESRLLSVLTNEEGWDCTRAVTQVAVRWANSHRYRSLKSLRSFFRTAGLHRGVRGDFVKENARRAIVAASVVVEFGVAKWTRH